MTQQTSARSNETNHVSSMISPIAAAGSKANANVICPTTAKTHISVRSEAHINVAHSNNSY
jgi:hypothetical protein